MQLENTLQLSSTKQIKQKEKKKNLKSSLNNKEFQEQVLLFEDAQIRSPPSPYVKKYIKLINGTAWWTETFLLLEKGANSYLT